MRLAADAIEAVRKTRHVPLDLEDAFTLFTAGMATWWPLATHSIAGDDGGGSRLELEHRGWEEFGAAEGATLRSRYEEGWDPVLTRLEAATSSTMTG